MTRVAITGLGLVCALGNTVGECWDNAVNAQTGIAGLREQGNPPYRFQVGAEARGFVPLSHFTEKDLILLERFAQMATVAAREAVAQSGLDFGSGLGEQTAIVTGSSVGGQFSEEEGYRRLYIDKSPRVAPLTIPRTMANAGASQISREFAIQGPTYTISTACSSSNHAIGQAFWMVRNGQVKAAITGGSEAVFAEGLLRAWEAMRVVSPEACRPFSADRRGLTLGEGAGMLVLEDWNAARDRGARILGEVIGFGMSSDAHHLTQPNVDGPIRAMQWAMRDAGLAPGQVDYINAHGTGTQANDAIETEAIQAAFGARARSIPVSSTKSMHGHALGAAGAIEAVLTTMALRCGTIPPTVNYQTPDPLCDLDVVPNHARRADLHIALSNTFAFGGLNATLAFRRSEV